MLSRTIQELLRRDPMYCAVVNKYTEPDASAFLTRTGCRPIQGLPFTCYVAPPLSTQRLLPSPQNKDKLLYYYTMDIASLLPVLALQPEADDSVFDMCAAPGGKTFALLQMLSLKGGLAVNDASFTRMTRLKTVISKSVSRGFKHAIRFTQRKGEDWPSIEQRSYDRVLVDAPCSSERHHLLEWLRSDSSGRYPDTESYGKLQQKLLFGALHAVKLDGRVVYSTCTLSETENDGVVQDTLKDAERHGMKVQVEPFQNFDSLLEYCNVTNTVFGKLIAPIQSKNCGPMYVSKLHLMPKR